MLAMDHIEAPVIKNMVLAPYPSIVVAGAYKGDTVAFVLEHHPTARVLAVEPQEFAMKALVETLANRPLNASSLHLWGCALLAENKARQVRLSEADTDAASMLELTGSRKTIEVRGEPAIEILRKSGFAFVDLFIMNMEGYEHYLIPWLLSHSNEVKIQRFLVQMHFPDCLAPEYRAHVYDYLRIRYTVEDIGKGWELWQRS